LDQQFAKPSSNKKKTPEVKPDKLQPAPVVPLTKKQQEQEDRAAKKEEAHWQKQKNKNKR